VYRCAGCAVVGHIQAVQVPGSGGVLADSNVEVVVAGEVPGRRVDLQGQHGEEERPGRRVVQAGRVGHERPPQSGRSVDLCRVAEEGVQVDHTGLAVPVRPVDPEDVVQRLNHVTRADA